MAVLDSVVPVVVLLSWPWNMVGMLPFGVGGMLSGVSILYLRRRNTSFEPFDTPTALVCDGPFRISRNPMYLGAALSLSGLAFAFGSLTPWIVLAGYVFGITRYIIRSEEEVMVKHFGVQYDQYRSTVRMWL